MATGMEFMLKSFGIDPDEIKKNVAGFGQMIVEIRDQLARIEGRLIRLEIPCTRGSLEPQPGDLACRNVNNLAAMNNLTNTTETTTSSLPSPKSEI